MSIFIGVFITILFVSLIVLSAFLGYKRGTIKSLIKFVFLILSAVLSFLLALLFSKLFYGKVVNKIAGILLKGLDLEIGLEYINVFLAIVKSCFIPITFVLLFICIYPLLLIFYWTLIKKRITETGKKNSKIGGIALSVTATILGFVCVLFPIGGYVSVVRGGAIYLKDTEIDGKTNGMLSTCESLGGSFVFKWTSKPSAWTFDIMAQTKYKGLNGKTYKLKPTKEILGLCEIYPELEEIIKNAESDSQEEMDFVGKALDVLNYSGVNSIDGLKFALTKIIRLAGTNWRNGGQFFDFNVKDLLDEINGDYFNAVIPVLDRLVNCTEDDLIDCLSSINKLLIALGRSQDFIDKLQNYANKLPDESGTWQELQEVVVEMSNLYDLMDEVNRKVFYDIIKITVDGFQLAGQEDPAFTYFFGIVIENLRDMQHVENYEEELLDAHETLTAIYVLLNGGGTEIDFIQNKLDIILNNAIKEDRVMYNTVQDVVEFNKTHNDIIKIRVNKDDATFAEAYIQAMRNIYRDNVNINKTLREINKVIVGK